MMGCHGGGASPSGIRPGRRTWVEQVPPLVVALIALAVPHVPAVDAYCWQPLKNPGFTEPPKVEQVSLSRVRVSWAGIVTNRDCADQFLVKYWQRNLPQGYKTSEPVPASANFIEVDIMPKVPYQFQAVAREDKGAAGVDWNKSPMVQFATSTYNEEVQGIPPPAPETPEPGLDHHDLDLVDKISEQTGAAASSPPPQLTDRERQGLLFAGITVELLAIIVIAGFVVLLVIVGIIYRMVSGRRKASSASIDDNDDDDEEAAGKGKVEDDDDDDGDDGDDDDEDNDSYTYKRGPAISEQTALRSDPMTLPRDT